MNIYCLKIGLYLCIGTSYLLHFMLLYNYMLRVKTFKISMLDVVKKYL